MAINYIKMNFFSDIIGHKKQIEQLSLEINEGNFSHLYLFAGPSNIGKTKILKAFVKSVLCSCGMEGRCENCLSFDRGASVDFVEYLDDGKKFFVADARNFIDKIGLSPVEKHKIFFIEKAERSTSEALNALLKLLEEPPKNTMIIMTSNDSSSILPTVVSRARVFNFSIPPREEVLDYLNKRFFGMEEERILKAFDFSFGRIGKAISLLEDPLLFDEYLLLEDEINKLMDENDVVEKFLFVEKLLSKKDTAKEKANLFYEVMTYFLEKKLRSKESNNSQKLNSANLLSIIYKDAILLKRNVNLRLLMENLMLLT